MMLSWGAAGSFVFFMLIGLLAGKIFHLEGPAWYFLMGVMGALGIGSSAILYYFQNRWRARKEESSAASSGGGAGNVTEADRWIQEANTRLAQSKGGAVVANLPMIFVAGDRGTAKTSTLLNSGVDPELLAGQIYQDNAIVPTRGANIFFARDTVFVEAGGTLLAQPGNWRALVAKLRPGKLKGGRGLAPRGVLLCFDLEAFARQGAADAVANAARYLQERFGEISQVLGISFPVYVLFTRADRVPCFTDFVRNLTHEEAGQVVGASLPIRPPVTGGVYAEEETQRLTAAFNQLFYSFCDQRLRLLPRETEFDRIPGAYEFPREFRKLRNLLVQFLVSVGRPSQLRASPFLRGFYFSGVRPVETQDMPAAVAPAAPAPPPAEVGGATGIFRAGMQAERRAQRAVAQPLSGSRKVPQWLFLGHLFNDVILADRAARSASGSSAKVSLAKRALLASAGGLCLIYIVLLLVSFFGNRGLQENAITAARNITAQAGAGGTLASEDDLRRLDTLRLSLGRLSNYHLNGAPLSLRWGLYRGDDILPDVRRAYYNKFRQLLFGSTQAQILAFLRGVPPAPAPADDYYSGYDALKAYLLTTSEWQRSKDPGLQTFLGSTLLKRWSGGREAEIGSRMDLARLQFDFYAHDLANGNPYTSSSDGVAVEHARTYLAGFSGVQRVYAFLLSEAAKQGQRMSFNQRFSGTAEVVTSPVPVEWAFTRDGWKFMQDQIKRQNFGGEAWVLGASQRPTADPATLAKGILDKYLHDYIEQWRSVLKGSRVNAYANFQDAGRKLERLTANDAPLLQLFWWTSQNTAVDPAVADKFRAVQAVVPPSEVPQYIVQQNQSYNSGLITLSQAVKRAANHEPDADRAVHDGADAATNTTQNMAATFQADLDAHVDRTTRDLLLQPIKYLDGMGAEDLKSGGARLCTAFNALTNKFPFNPSTQAEVSLEELGDILRPKTGKLWTFYDTTLKSALQCQNGDCTPQGSPPLNPRFVSSISQLMKFSLALYGDSGTDPKMKYTLRPQPNDRIDEYVITVNGQATRLKANASQTFDWPGTGTRGFQLTLKLGGSDLPPVEEFTGTWALFRFFADADRQPAPNAFVFAVRQGQQNKAFLNYSFYADTGGATAVFGKDFLSTLKCVVPVTR